MALEAGDQKARYGLGYTLVELGEFREAYDHLRIYTELTPHNAWAWCWLGRACEGLGENVGGRVGLPAGDGARGGRWIRDRRARATRKACGRSE